ncbi:unnamed protein product [Arctia plantaginis]|uniref:Uncharacterized protein n=1 Tax=Arctia plantaginis TaxID=874455 RepID=A0A8S0YW73_ARCPL|nr:unnamed protein product [Arctia plantaginis]
MLALERQKTALDFRADIFEFFFSDVVSARKRAARHVRGRAALTSRLPLALAKHQTPTAAEAECRRNDTAWRVAATRAAVALLSDTQQEMVAMSWTAH